VVRNCPRLNSGRPLLSIYGTIFNSVNTVRPVIDNIFETFDKIKENIEIVIVDNYSNDGTYESIKEMAENHNIILLRKRSTRGEGRNIAFSQTLGKYVLNRDFDDLYIDRTMYILLNKFKDYLDKDVIINEMSRREIIERIGNWSNLNAGEDVELKARAVKNNVRLLGIPAIIGMNYNILKNSSNGITLLNEKRYSKGIKYIERMANWIMDTTQGYGIKLSDFKHFDTNYKLAFFAGIFLSRIYKRKIYRYFEMYNNLQIAELKKEYLNPDIFNIQRERWITTINSEIGKEIIDKKVNLLNKMGFDNIFKSGPNIILCHKDAKHEYMSLY